MNKEMSERDYFDSFMKECIYDLRTTGKCAVFTLEHVNFIQKIIPVNIEYSDETFIYLIRKNKNIIKPKERHY